MLFQQRRAVYAQGMTNLAASRLLLGEDQAEGVVNVQAHISGMRTAEYHVANIKKKSQ